MPKKHREKRRKYVEHLLKVEKERDIYLDKRINRKRGRENVEEEEEGKKMFRAITPSPCVKRYRPERSLENEEGGVNFSFDGEKSSGEGAGMQRKDNTHTSTTAEQEKEASSSLPRVKKLKRRY